MRWTGLRFLAALGALVALLAVSHPAVAKEDKRLARLTVKQRQVLLAYEKAQVEYNATLDRYWSTITEKRSERRRKRKAGEPIVAEDYVADFPPRYKGPDKPVEILKLIPKDPDAERKTGRVYQPVVADYLKAAADHFGFVPDSIPELEFKRRYALSALDADLTRDQIVRVYALETGGIGTVDMQTGIDPVTKKGRAVSSALGYAQLLDANSVDQIGQHGTEYAHRLQAMAAADGVTPERKRSLLRKAEQLRSMVEVAHSVPNEWNEHRKLATTPRGMALHALNLDGDIGPWLQVDKLNDIRLFAAERGMAELTGGELELMNLAGPGTGFEMLQPVAQDKPTANFFERGGYYRNPVVHDRTAAGLLQALDERMDAYLKKSGSQEFLAVFEEVMGKRQASE